MKIFEYKNRTVLVVTALTSTVLIMVPLIAGAAPGLIPPNGTTVPTFNGMNINNGTVTNLNINSDGKISNPYVTTETDPTCKNNKGESFSGGCDYGVSISDFGGLRIRSDLPMTPPGWFFADTKINSNGIDIYSQNHKALNVHADTEVVGLYTSDFNVNSNGIRANVNDTDGGFYTTHKGFDLTGLDNMKLYSTKHESIPDITDPSTWRGGAFINMDAKNSKLELGARKISFGDYTALSVSGDATFTETASIDNSTTPVTMEVKGHLKASGGIGNYSTLTATGLANANATKFFTSPCPSNYKVLSCGYSWPSFNNTLDLIWMYPSVDKCMYMLKNNDTVAHSLTGYATCYNDKI